MAIDDSKVFSEGGYPIRYQDLSPNLQAILANVSYDSSTGLTTWQVDGTIIGYKDNATSFRLEGPSSPNDPSAGADVQSYAGMFYNDAYSTVGTLKTRASYGANLEMDLALQSPHALLLIAQDGSQTDGVIKACTQTAFEIHARYSAEQLSPSRLIVDRVDTATYGSANTSDVNVTVNAGNLRLMSGSTDGAVIFPSLTTTERNALTGVAGMVIYNETTGKLNVYTSAWEEITSS